MRSLAQVSLVVGITTSTASKLLTLGVHLRHSWSCIYTAQGYSKAIIHMIADSQMYFVHACSSVAATGPCSSVGLSSEFGQ